MYFRILLITIFILSCNSPTEKPDMIHNFQLRLDLSQLPASVSSIRGQLNNSNSDLIVFDFDFDTITETATTTISEIPVGEWTLTVNALDENEIVTHSASTAVLIHSGLNEVNLVFEAVTGELTITTGFEDEIQAPEIIFFGKIINDSTHEEILLENLDSLFKLFSPNPPLTSALSFEFNEAKFITYIYMDYSIAEGPFMVEYLWREKYLNKQVKHYFEKNFLPYIAWQDLYTSVEYLVYVEFIDTHTNESYYIGAYYFWGTYPFVQLKNDYQAKIKKLSNCKQKISLN